MGTGFLSWRTGFSDCPNYPLCFWRGPPLPPSLDKKKINATSSVPSKIAPFDVSDKDIRLTFIKCWDGVFPYLYRSKLRKGALSILSYLISRMDVSSSWYLLLKNRIQGPLPRGSLKRHISSLSFYFLKENFTDISYFGWDFFLIYLGCNLVYIASDWECDFFFASWIM